jgi:hypothetical protein
LPASSRTFDEPTERTFLHSSTAVIFSASAVMVMKPKGVAKDRFEITDSLMPQLLSIFELGKQDLKVVEKLNPKTYWVLGL